MGRLEAAVARLNPRIPEDARRDAIRQITGAASQSLTEENRRIHALLVNGVDVEFKADDGTIRGDKVWLVDFENPQANDWLMTNQFTVIEGKHNRRPDVVVFLNGLPVAVIELKNAASEAATIEDAFAQLQTYKLQVPSLFRTNAVLISSDGLLARIGSLTANEERSTRGGFWNCCAISRCSAIWARERDRGDPARRRPPYRCDLAHPGVRQVAAHGVLRGVAGAQFGDGEPDPDRPDRPQRSG